MSNSVLHLRPLKKDEHVGITVPTRNRSDYLAALLTSLASQTYRHWSLVIRDGSDSPIEETSVIQDLLDGIRAQGQPVHLVRGTSGWDRHQHAMEALPVPIEFVLRVDDDVTLSPDYLEKSLQPFALLPELPIAAVGGTLPQPHLQECELEPCLTRPGWCPTVERPSWKLQGHSYRQRELVEAENLYGSAMLYRRSAVTHVGGWAVKGYSQQAHCEESDMGSRLRAAGFTLLVTTAARGWHLYAPGGGARQVKKSADGVKLISDAAVLERDAQLYQKRLSRLLFSGLEPRPLSRYRITDLERGSSKKLPLVSNRERLLGLFRGWRNRIRLRTRLRKLYDFFSNEDRT